MRGNSSRSLFDYPSSHTRSFGSHADVADALEQREYPSTADSYVLLEEAGRGVSAKVWKAICVPYDEEVAVKVLDLESVNCRLDELIREAQAMKNFQHPNVLTLLTSFVRGRELYMVMPFMSGGSMLNIIKYKYPEGLPEPLIAVVLREVLKGLDYLHRNNTIHRDVKSGNILVGEDGRVLLGDFGVVAQLERGDFRKTFVGTPCWMAPEVMEQTEGYNTSADIWSFGITMLELAHGHAPFARYPPMKVLLMTLQNPPPTLEESGNRHFSKSMKEIVQKCLNKDPTRRPTAAQLMEMRFFKNAGKTDPLAELVQKLPALTERVKQLNQGKVPHDQGAVERMEKSNEEYLKGVSAWDFNIAELKQQAEEEPNPALSHLAPIGGAFGSILEFQQSPQQSGPQLQRASAPSGEGTATASTGSKSMSTKSMSLDTEAAQKTLYEIDEQTSTPNQSSKSKQRQVGRFTITDNVENSPADDRGQKLMDSHVGGQPSPSTPPPPSSSAESDHKQQTKSRFTVVQEEKSLENLNTEKPSDLQRKSVQSKQMQDNIQINAQAVFDKTMQQALPRLQEIQEAQRALADAHNSLLAAINEAQKGKKEMLAKYVAYPYVKVISGKQLHEFEQIKDLKSKLMALQDENRQLRQQLQSSDNNGQLVGGNGQQEATTKEVKQQQPQTSQQDNGNKNRQ
eukprot:TRINITY_DN2389_c1_g1_i1.p1 TRINITY_DN2389_c1_g1~~TRINITY_DN2389_c1_g1_i1.p1  ORF type:complete len:683 (+),score=135.85 TRINITY_DN2389_c1_g1_i1:218-2266(+)